MKRALLLQIGWYGFAIPLWYSYYPSDNCRGLAFLLKFYSDWWRVFQANFLHWLFETGGVIFLKIGVYLLCNYIRGSYFHSEEGRICEYEPNFWCCWWIPCRKCMFLLFKSREKLHWWGGRTNKEKDKAMSSNVFRKILAYTSLVCRCKYPRQRGACKKYNSQFFCKVSKVSGTLTLWAVKGSYFQGHFKTFLERKKKLKQIYQIRVSAQFKVVSS